MINNQMVVAIVPARAGSKRLPRKNLLVLRGKPLIAWTIDAALRSKYIDRVIVSTDSEEISNISMAYGAEVPFLRPKELATDTASTNDVIIHALNNIGEPRPIITIILQPTSPLRAAEDIDGALDEMIAKGAKGMVSVCECEHSPLWANTLPKDNDMDGFIPAEIMGRRSQELAKFYRLNGAIFSYVTSDLIENCGVFYKEGVYAYEMHSMHSVDIDQELDFLFAEFLLSRI